MSEKTILNCGKKKLNGQKYGNKKTKKKTPNIRPSIVNATMSIYNDIIKNGEMKIGFYFALINRLEKNVSERLLRHGQT